MQYKTLGNSNISIPPIIFGTSCLGNLYQAISMETKLAIMRAIAEQMDGPFVLDTAGKYGAGLALEVIGKGLDHLNVGMENAIISNKLGWLRTPLTTPEPTFEPGAWVGLKNDAEQKISYEGILQCWEQGCELLGGRKPQIVSVHDPDEYVAPFHNDERDERFNDIVEAYRALEMLREQGKTTAVGVGAKDWHVIRDITNKVDLDWVMLAVSFTIYTHSQEMLDFLDELHNRNIAVINSAVFHAGFLTGGRYFDYQVLNKEQSEHAHYFKWRERFFDLCKEYNVLPSDACVQFGMSHPAVISIALNTSKPERVEQNIRSVSVEIPGPFWKAMKDNGLIDINYPHINV